MKWILFKCVCCKKKKKNPYQKKKRLSMCLVEPVEALCFSIDNNSSDWYQKLNIKKKNSECKMRKIW